jgi:succinyl-CoA synthetase beta subunit
MHDILQPAAGKGFCVTAEGASRITFAPSMNIHEYQAKQLLARHGVAVPAGVVCSTTKEVRAAAERFLAEGASRVVVKAQIHAGGRGKGTFQSGFQGGVRLSGSAVEAESDAASMLGGVLVTRQTGPEGRMVHRVLVEAASAICRELYLAVLLDRARGRPVMMASTAGGMNIEEVAEQTPELICREPVDPAVGLMPYQARKLAVSLGLRGSLIAAASRLMDGVWRSWWDWDASLIEINPLAIIRDRDGIEHLMVVDAKVSLDDNALFRHADLLAMRDLAEESALEVEASRFQLNYIKLTGNIACLVNGAGLAMATMDIIEHYGGRPANFLDVGGGASAEQVTAAFRIILQDPLVEGILVNIFGGIMDCNVIATGIVNAARETHLNLPLVVRLEGNNVELANRTLANSGLTIRRAESMANAAQQVIQAVQGGSESPP